MKSKKEIEIPEEELDKLMEDIPHNDTESKDINPVEIEKTHRKKLTAAYRSIKNMFKGKYINSGQMQQITEHYHQAMKESKQNIIKARAYALEQNRLQQKESTSDD